MSELSVLHRPAMGAGEVGGLLVPGAFESRDPDAPVGSEQDAGQLLAGCGIVRVDERPSRNVIQDLLVVFQDVLDQLRSPSPDLRHRSAGDSSQKPHDHPCYSRFLSEEL